MRQGSAKQIAPMVRGVGEAEPLVFAPDATVFGDAVFALAFPWGDGVVGGVYRSQPLHDSERRRRAVGQLLPGLTELSLRTGFGQ